MDKTTESMTDIFTTAYSDELISETAVNQHLASYTVGVSAWVHVICVPFFMIIGSVENVIVIYIYSRKLKNYRANIYVIALAVLDLTYCLLLVPLLPFIVNFKDTIWFEIFALVLVTVVLCFLYLLTAVSMDRCYAVLWPFKYRDVQARHKFIVAGIVAMVIFFTVGEQVFKKENVAPSYKFVIGATVLISFSLLLVTYSVIIAKLYQQGRRIGTAFKVLNKSAKPSSSTWVSLQQQTSFIGTEQAIVPSISVTCIDQQNQPDNELHAACSTRTTSFNATAAKLEPASTKFIPLKAARNRNCLIPNSANDKTRARHVTMVKIFMAITLLYFTSYVPLLLQFAGVIVHDARINLYIYAINHIGNPIIYYIFNKNFRGDVQKLIGKLRS